MKSWRDNRLRRRRKSNQLVLPIVGTTIFKIRTKPNDSFGFMTWFVVGLLAYILFFGIVSTVIFTNDNTHVTGIFGAGGNDYFMKFIEDMSLPFGSYIEGNEEMKEEANEKADEINGRIKKEIGLINTKTKIIFDSLSKINKNIKQIDKNDSMLPYSGGLDRDKLSKDNLEKVKKNVMDISGLVFDISGAVLNMENIENEMKDLKEEADKTKKEGEEKIRNILDNGSS